jgi:hypothetical protein
MQRIPSYDSLIVVAGHSMISQPLQQNPIPPNMTFVTACLVNQKLVAQNFTSLFTEFERLFTHRFIKLDPLDRKSTLVVKPMEGEIENALIAHRAKSGVSAVCFDSHAVPDSSGSKWTKCVPSIFTMTKNQQPLTVQDCFLDGPPLPIQGVFLTTHGSSARDISAEILGMKPFVNVPVEHEEDIIPFERWFFLNHDRNPTDDEVLHNLNRYGVTQENIVNLREKRIKFLNAMNFPLYNLQKYSVAALQQLCNAINDAITQNPILIDDYSTNKQQVNDAIWETLTPQLKSVVYFINPTFEHALLAKWHNLPRIIRKPSDLDIFNEFVFRLIQKKFLQNTRQLEPIKSDLLLERIRANCHGNVCIIFIGCRGNEPPGSPMHSPRSSGVVKHTFGGTKTPKRKTKNKLSKTKFSKTKLSKTKLSKTKLSKTKFSKKNKTKNNYY